LGFTGGLGILGDLDIAAFGDCIGRGGRAPVDFRAVCLLRGRTPPPAAFDRVVDELDPGAAFVVL